MKITLRILSLLCIFLIKPLWAINLRFESGYLRSVSFQESDQAKHESEALAEFFSREFEMGPDLQWQISKKVEDTSHIHSTYDLFYKKHPVFSQHLKIHYNKKGFVQYATSTLRGPLEVEPSSEALPWESQKRAIQNLLFPSGGFRGTVKGELGIWLDSDGRRGQWAFEVETLQGKPFHFRKVIVSADGREVLNERKLSRELTHRDSFTVNVYRKFPQSTLSALEDASGAGLSSQTISSEPGKLLNNYSWVRRDSGTFVEVDPATLYTPSGDGATYGGSSTNQKADAVNVFHHISNYREWFDGILAALGSTGIYSFDPMPVIVNYQTAIDGNTSNNALYYGGPCSSDSVNQRCIVFYPPTASFRSLAREALVIAHEYQHYLTDMLTGIEFDASGEISVGSALHEGYSDYLAATYVSSQTLGAGKIDAHVVGEYSLTATYQRDLTQYKIFNNNTTYASVHGPGQVWGSALWEMREDGWGAEIVDKIVVRSLYYLSTQPGFIDSVEALVQADRDLYDGVHENRIRELLFTERNWLGSLSDVFQDSDKKIVKVGFQGCSSVKETNTGSSPLATGMFSMLWILATWAIGRRRTQ